MYIVIKSEVSTPLCLFEKKTWFYNHCTLIIELSLYSEVKHFKEFLQINCSNGKNRNVDETAVRFYSVSTVVHKVTLYARDQPRLHSTSLIILFVIINRQKYFEQRRSYAERK